MRKTSFIGGFALCLGAFLLAPSSARAQNGAGECNSGFCGTPNNNGGGCSCSCGGSVLVANTDVGNTYSTSDDYDGDGIVDDYDNCPFIANRDQSDSDGDGVGNACDNCMNVANKDQSDINGNHVGDACDPDMDGDKVANASDNCPKVPNADQGDIDKDGIGDSCDPDMDGDGVLNGVDNCPRVYNPDQSKTIPGLNGDACDSDADKDQVEDSRDNCPAVYNPDQKDTDGDGMGDACDTDIDNDGVLNSGIRPDNCPTVANADQKDSDYDGVGDACSRGFCFVAGKNRVAPCLDPKNVFQVTAAPKVTAKTGETVYLALYSNRAAAAANWGGVTTDVGIKYSFAITTQPDGANDTVSHPTGSVATSQEFEYRFADDATRPTFVPTQPGTYVIHLSSDLVNADTLFPNAGHAEGDVTVNVTGEPTNGCSVGANPSQGAAMMAMVLLALLGISRRRRIAK